MLANANSKHPTHNSTLKQRKIGEEHCVLVNSWLTSIVYPENTCNLPRQSRNPRLVKTHSTPFQERLEEKFQS